MSGECLAGGWKSLMEGCANLVICRAKSVLADSSTEDLPGLAVNHASTFVQAGSSSGLSDINPGNRQGPLKSIERRVIRSWADMALLAFSRDISGGDWFGVFVSREGADDTGCCSLREEVD